MTSVQPFVPGVHQKARHPWAAVISGVVLSLAVGACAQNPVTFFIGNDFGKAIRFVGGQGFAHAPEIKLSDIDR